MAQHPDIQSILQILAGQGAPVDPRGQALLGGLAQGIFPEEDRLSNFNTALDFLSPSASRDLQDQLGGPEALGAILGLGPEDIEQIIRQDTGLAVSPAQQLQGQQALMALLPDFLNAQTKQGELGVSQGELTVKQGELGVAETEAAADASRAETLANEEARLQKQYEEGSPQDKQAMFDLNLQNMALTGVTITGQVVDKNMQRNAFRLLTIGQSSPETVAIIKGLIEDGDFDTAGQMIGLDPGTLRNAWNFIGKRLDKDADLSAVQPGVQRTDVTRGVDADTELTETADTMLEQLFNLLSGGDFQFQGRQGGTAQ